MKVIKVLTQDTECHNCGRKVNRKTAEIEDWSEVHFVDLGGMPLHRVYICQYCEDTWNHQKYEAYEH